MRVLWDERAWEQYLSWQTEDRKTLKRINMLMCFSDLEFFRLFRAIHEAIDRFTILSSINLIPAGLQRLEMEQAKRNQNKENGMSPGYGQYAS